MSSRISSEPLMSISNKHNYKTISKSPTASLLHCIGNILSHSSGKWRDSLTVCSEFHLRTIFIHYYLLSNSVIISSKKKMIPIPLLVFHLVEAFGTAKGFFYLISNSNKCVSFKFTKFLRSNEL